MSEQTVVAALYKFVRLPDYQEIQPRLQQRCIEASLRGTLLLAEEGLNGTVAGTRKGIDAVLAWLRADPRLADLEHKESFTSEMPFHRMKVRLKKEIVTMGVPGTDPKNIVGTYLDAEQWNAMLDDPDVVVVDTRNDYEVAIGTFDGANDPKTTTFREFPDYVQRELSDKKDKKIAMFCTGGIRCEKSTSYLKAEGFGEVYHLKGGILKYLETVDPEENRWQGDCFVFDDRVSVDKDLKPGNHVLCHACRRPLTIDEQQSEHYVPGISCSYCIDTVSEERRARFAERQKQINLAKARGEAHLGMAAQPSKSQSAE